MTWLAEPGQVDNVLKDRWSLVEKSEQVVDVDSDLANAVPAGSDWATDLIGAEGPNYKELTYTSGWRTSSAGDATTTVTMRVFWLYGAKYRGGGAYIPTAWVQATAIEPALENNVDISVSVGQPTNAGTETAPIAVLPLSIAIREDPMVPGCETHQTYSVVLYGTGQGYIHEG
ncbi:MAG: hypothetical protein ACRD0U_15560 [Acidimicrobiales bacterium]